MALLLLGAAAAAGSLDLRVAEDGRRFSIDVGGAPWLEMAPTFLQANGMAHEATGGAGGLELRNFTGGTAGSDEFGRYIEYRWSWRTTGSSAVAMETSARALADGGILWTQSFPQGVEQYGYGSAIDLNMRKEPTWGSAGTGWPALSQTNHTPALEFVTFLGDGNAEFGAGLGSPTLPVERGAAVGYFNASGYTLVLSTAASFLSSVIHAPHRNLLRCGVQGAASSIPAGHSTSFLMHAGQGVPETFMGWGDRLLARYHKPRPEPNSSVSLQYIGYSSTGSYFCTPSRHFPSPGLCCAADGGSEL